MTGVLNAVVGQPAGLRYTVTIVQIQSSPVVYGYNSSGGFGAVSPSTFKGRNVIDVSSNQGVGQFAFNVALSGTDSQSFFQAVWVQGTDGIWKLYRTSDGNYSANIWAWDQVGTKPWTATTPSTRAIILVP